MMTFRIKAFSMPLKKRGKALNNVIKAENWFRENPDSLFANTITNEQIIQKLAQEIERMDWGFLYTKDSEFITCDNPHIYSKHCGIRDYNSGFIVFSISKNISLLITNFYKFNDSYIECSNKTVAEINDLIVRNAHNQVYASHNCEKINSNVTENLGKHLS